VPVQNDAAVGLVVEHGAGQWDYLVDDKRAIFINNNEVGATWAMERKLFLRVV